MGFELNNLKSKVKWGVYVKDNVIRYLNKHEVKVLGLVNSFSGLSTIARNGNEKF